MPLLPFKLNQAGRHHIPRQKHKITNWPAYDASLRQRGSLTVWFTDEAITAWAAEPRTTRGGQPWYSPLVWGFWCQAGFQVSRSCSSAVPRLKVFALTIRGEPAIRCDPRTAILSSVGSTRDPDQEAAKRFGGEAPRRRAHSGDGIEAMGECGSPPPRIVNGSLSRPASGCRNCVLAAYRAGRSGRRPKHDPLRHGAGDHHAPQRHPQLARERRNHGGLACALGGLGARPVPLHDCAVFLEPEEPPGELDQATAHASVSRLRQPPLPALGAALVGRSREPGIARDRPSIPQVAGQHLPHQ